MKNIFKWLCSKRMNSFNVPDQSSLSYLKNLIHFKHSGFKTNNWLDEVQPVKIQNASIYTDTRTKSKDHILVLFTNSVKIDYQKIIINCRDQGFKTWVVQSLNSAGSLNEFEIAYQFIKEKCPVLAFGTWINYIQDSPNLEKAMVVAPIFNLKPLNEKISEENHKRLEYMEKDKQNQVITGKHKKIYSVQPLVPELKYNKPLFFYLLNNKENPPNDSHFSGIYDKKGWLNSEPLGCREKFIVQIFSDFIKFK